MVRGWYDEAADWRVRTYMEAFHPQLMTHQTGWRNRMVVGGRGYGKRAAQIEALRRWNSRPGVYRPKDVSRLGSVRWACPRPTDPPAPVYAVGTNGWLMEQYLARLTPEMRKHNRRIAEENAAIMDRYADLLGVKPHGADDSQVQKDAGHR